MECPWRVCGDVLMEMFSLDTLSLCVFIHSWSSFLFCFGVIVALTVSQHSPPPPPSSSSSNLWLHLSHLHQLPLLLPPPGPFVSSALAGMDRLCVCVRTHLIHMQLCCLLSSAKQTV